MIMQTLSDFYRSRLDGLRAFSASLDDDDDYDGPFLMADPPPNFIQSRHRVLIIGQETNGWIGGFCGTNEEDLSHNIDTYKQFNFGENYQSPFFQYAHKIVADLTDNDLWMWSNVFKFGKASGKGTPPEKINHLEIMHFNVLCEEIRILNPTCVVFMTGPDYDCFLEQRIPNVLLSPIGKFGLRQMARVSSKFLPEASYRIYHPGYGNRDVEMYQETLDLVRTDYSQRY